MPVQIAQSNAGSDSPYFLLTPLTVTTSFVAVYAIPVFSTNDITQRKIDIMFGIPSFKAVPYKVITCFDSYACYLLGISLISQSFQNVYRDFSFQGVFPGVY